jgi:hypothetical protein
MNSARLRDPYEIPLYVFSVLINLLIIAFILAGALLLGYLNVLAGEPLSGPVVDVIRAAFFALLLLVPGLVLYSQLTRAGIRRSAVRLSRRQFPDIYAVKEDFAQVGPAKGSRDLLDVRQRHPKRLCRIHIRLRLRGDP